MFTEDDLVPLSALQHLVFCERQCALIHVDQVWRDNPLTLQGSHSHERVHDEAARRELRGALMITRGLPLRSFRLGLSGKADVVEFHRRACPRDPPPSEGGLVDEVALAGVTGLWQPFPVEYKRGKPKADHCDEVQLCAQALCLEEMLSVRVAEGALFYGRIQKRHDVSITAALRHETEVACARLHELLLVRRVPRVKMEPKCKQCSLFDVCQPAATAPGRSASRYLARALAAVRREEEGEP